MRLCPDCFQALNPHGCIVCKARKMLYNPDVAKVLDFDKTLFDTGKVQSEANPLTFGQLGVPIKITPEIAETFRGKSDEEIFGALLGDVNRDRIHEAIRLRNDILQHLAIQIKEVNDLLLPGMDRFALLLHQTQQQAGIASVSPDIYINEFLNRSCIEGTKLIKIFPRRAVIGSTKIKQLSNGTNPLLKPHPFSLYRAAEKIKRRKKAEILYFGDSRVDALSVCGQERITGIIIDNKHYESILCEFGNESNIGVVRSMADLIPSL